MRCAQQQLAVLKRARLTLVAIDYDERAVVLAASARGPDGITHVAPLLHHGNAGPAEAAQIRVAELLDERLRPAADLRVLRPILLRLPRADGLLDFRVQLEVHAQLLDRGL